jgi:hypothetical protein
VITFATARPVRQAAKFGGEHDTHIWRVFEHYVGVGVDGSIEKLSVR